MISRKNIIVESAGPRGIAVPLLAGVMVSVMLACSANVYGQFCILPANGSRTIDLPAECTEGYTAPFDHFLITHNPDQAIPEESIPEGSSVRIEMGLHSFSSIVRTPGGNLGDGGEIQNFFAGAPFQMSGTGDLSSFSHLGFLSGVEVETHSAPQIPADEMNTDIELVSLLGQTPPFDAVFSFFQLTIGSAQGLPESPGQVRSILMMDGTCQGGAQNQQACADDVHCPDANVNGVCVGGENDGIACLGAYQCPEGACVNPGSCFCAYCFGGDNAGQACIDSNGCPDSWCEEIECQPQFYVSGTIDVSYRIDYEAKSSLGIPEALRSKKGWSTGTIRMQMGAIPTMYLAPLGGPGREISINPGDEVLIEAYLRDLIPQELTAYQVTIAAAADPMGTSRGSVIHNGETPGLYQDRWDYVFGGVFTCHAGFFDGGSCVTDDQCPGMSCIDGPNEGSPCLEAGECAGRSCDGGRSDNLPCDTNANCPGASCKGGTSDGALCTEGSDCPNGNCVGGDYEGLICSFDALCGPDAVCEPATCEDATCEEGSCVRGTCPGSGMWTLKQVGINHHPVIVTLLTPPFPVYLLPVVEGDKYLGQATYVSSPDACGDFMLNFVEPGAGNDSLTLLMGREQGQTGIEFTAVGAIIHLPPCTCDDIACAAQYADDPCLDGQCIGGECEGVPVPPDTPCDDQDPGTCNDVCVDGDCMGDLDPVPGAPYIVHGTAAPGETTPCTGYTDSRLESTNGSVYDLGIDRVTLVFSEPVVAVGGGTLGPASFAVTETGPGAVPQSVIDVITADNVTVEVILERIITLQEWTTLQAIVEDECGQPIQNDGDLGPGVAEDDRIDVGALPGEVNQTGGVGPQDLADLSQYLLDGGYGNACADPLYFDIDRDGITPEPQDLIRFRQIIAGTSPATQMWDGEVMNASQP